MMEFLGALFWAVVGFGLDRVFTYIIQPEYRKWQKKKAIERSNILYLGSKTEEFINEYYSRSKHSHNLFTCKIQNTTLKIPFITSKEWQNLNIDILSKRDIVQLVKTSECKYPVNKKMIKKRESLGQRLFDDRSIYLHKVEKNGDKLVFLVGEYDYFQRLSFLSNFEKETYQAATSKFMKSTPMRDKYIPDCETAVLQSHDMMPFGCDVVFAINYQGATHICLHTRSDKTITYPKAKMLVPSFGFSPDANLENDIMFHCFIKEYCEEMFDIEDLEEQGRHANPKWFYTEKKPARNMLKLIDEKKITLTLLGFGFDVTSCYCNLAVLAHVTDEEASSLIYDTCVGNWETENKHSIGFIPITSPKLSEWLLEKKFVPSTAFALSLALQVLE